LNLINGSIIKFNLYSISEINKNGFSLALNIICFKKVLGDWILKYEYKELLLLIFLLLFNKPKDK
jgi:hypothetical protein